MLGSIGIANQARNLAVPGPSARRRSGRILFTMNRLSRAGRGGHVCSSAARHQASVQLRRRVSFRDFFGGSLPEEAGQEKATLDGSGRVARERAHRVHRTPAFNGTFTPFGWPRIRLAMLGQDADIGFPFPGRSFSTRMATLKSPHRGARRRQADAN